MTEEITRTRGLATGRPLIRVQRRVMSRLIVLYAPLALAWTLGAAFLVAAISDDNGVALWFSVVEGTMFVALTTWLLNLILRRALRDAESHRVLFQAVVEDAPDVILRMTLKPTLRFDYISPASLGLTGHSPEDFYADPSLVFRLVHPEDATRLTDILTNPSTADTSVELRFLHKDDGAVVSADAAIKWEIDGAGQPVGAIAVVRNSSARQEAQRHARLLATAIEAAGEAVMVTDAQGAIEYVNPAFERLSGYERSELVGQNPRILRSGRQNERFYARLWSTLRSGGTFRGRFVNRAKGGRLYEQRSTITPVVGPGGEVSHFVAVSQDVTVEREIHRQIAATEKAAAVAQLAAGMAHDFRNFLNVVSANVDLLRAQDHEDPEVAQGLMDIERAADAGTNLVTRLLQLSRPAEARRSLVSLTALVRDLEGIMRAAVKKSVEVSFRLEDAVPPIHLDRMQIDQAVVNLVRNASQAMPTGGSLTVSVERATQLPAHAAPDQAPHAFVRLTVKDTGVGMDAEVLSHIYDPFYTTKESGTGLGVPMVRQTVEDHGGYLDFKSTPGRGTEASIYLPAAEETLLAGQAEGPAGVITSLPLGTEHILVVEDDSSLRRATERALTSLGYRVDTVDGGLAAITKLEEGIRWDLILTDLVMPGLGGAELYRRLEERDIGVPVVFVSGHPPELLDLTSRARPTAFLQKPWTIPSLSQVVRSVLDTR